MAKIITVCSSAVFYKHVNDIAVILEKKGYEVIVPQNAVKMRQTGNYDVASTKTWYDNPDDFVKKRQYMDDHFKEVEKADALLLVNDEKKGIKGYIGPNGLMEMALGYYLKKPIYILNPVTKDNTVYEEVLGMGCEIINGDLEKIQV
jgi:hypothetical protein